MLDEKDKAFYADSAYRGAEEVKPTEIQNLLPDRTHLRIHDEFHARDYYPINWHDASKIRYRIHKS